MSNKFKALLGFASKSGKISSGQEQVINSIRNGRANLVIVSEDTSEGSKKKIFDKSLYYGVVCIEYMNRDELSRCIGKTAKTCISINDKGFAESILKIYEEIIKVDRQEEEVPFYEKTKNI